jgi:hypothetical protein
MKRSMRLSPITKIEGTAILTSALFYAWTGNPAWFAALLGIVVIALTFHELADRLTHATHSGRRSSRSAGAATRQAKRPLKRLPRLVISEGRPIGRPARLDGYTIELAAPTTHHSRPTQRGSAGGARSRGSSGRRQAAALAA